MSSLPKLHELLAVNKSLATQAAKVRGELASTFEKKRHLFEEKLTTFNSTKDGLPSGTENASTLQTTVVKEFGLLQPFLAKAIDAAYQVAEANTVSRADVVLDDGTTLLTGVPATALLELEKRIEEVRQLLVRAKASTRRAMSSRRARRRATMSSRSLPPRWNTRLRSSSSLWTSRSAPSKSRSGAV